MSAERGTTIREMCPFRLVVDEDMDQLDREITMSSAEAGSTIFEDGDSADDLVVVMEGTVDVLKDGRILGTLGPGSLLGEVSAFVPSSSRTATIRANSAVRMIRWRTDHVRSRLARHERLATAIVADMAFVLSERLDRRTEDVVSVLKAAGTRLPVSELERLRGRTVQ